MKLSINPDIATLRYGLNRQEAAQAIGHSLATLDRLTKRGLLRPSRATRRPSYAPEELKRFMRETTADASTQCAAPPLPHPVRGGAEAGAAPPGFIY